MENDAIHEKLVEHDKRLDKHDDKFDKLERNDAINKIRIDNLCKSLDNLTGTLKWLSGFLLTATGLLVVYFIEQLVKR
ncbi:hemolysin XhlA family protein [uncultured Clostridium sp.]|uniref:hemolysin XhlA family protein n=1 Tax=uncultured Clostridium sp. TaxID=59620 RepID=UPI0028E92631|nr:hemolysin XhlA family protein [uncultured Clostridium sp.]